MVYSSWDLAFNLVHLKNSGAAKQVVEALAVFLRQTGAIEIPSDYTRREVRVSYERWAPSVGRIVDALESVLVSNGA